MSKHVNVCKHKRILLDILTEHEKKGSYRNSEVHFRSSESVYIFLSSTFSSLLYEVFQKWTLGVYMHRALQVFISTHD